MRVVCMCVREKFPLMLIDKLFSNFEYCVILLVQIWLNEFKTTENLFQFYLLFKRSLYGI